MDLEQCCKILGVKLDATQAGIKDAILRFSTGIGDVGDLIGDIEKAIGKSR